MPITGGTQPSCLQMVFSIPREMAKVWFETHEEELPSWDICKEKLGKFFGRPVGHQLAAKKELAACAQTSTKPYMSYMRDILSLCHGADTQMTGPDKVGHGLKGIADDAF